MDLRGNTGGSVYVTYYFLSLLLGDNDPDIHFRPLSLNQQADTNYHQILEDILNKQELRPLYESLKFGSPIENFVIKKNIAEDVTFKKMIILVDEMTGSGGEIAAATLKNTLGSKICIIGKPCGGSFEEHGGGKIELPHNFVLYLPKSGRIFYSKKYHKLLTGYRLLPDIRYNDMDTILNKALQIINQSISCPEDPTYERTIKQ